jgi:hypothetical protein
LSKRIRLITLPFCLAAVIALIAGCGGADSNAPDGPSADANTDPQTVLDSALGSQGDPISSGVLDLSFDLKSASSVSANAKITGPFSSNGDDELPSVDFDVTAGAQTGSAPLSFNGVLTMTPDGFYIGYGDNSYKLDDATFQLLKQSYQQSSQLQQNQQDSGSLSQFGIDPADWLTNVKNEGTTDLGQGRLDRRLRRCRQQRPAQARRQPPARRPAQRRYRHPELLDRHRRPQQLAGHLRARRRKAARGPARPDPGAVRSARRDHGRDRHVG